MAVLITQKPCLHCGQLIPITRHNAKHPSHYARRKYCSRACNNRDHKRFGPANPQWDGLITNVHNGRSRALYLYPSPGACQRCGRILKRIDRHHIDGNTSNNLLNNIAFLCRRCHMQEDGRLARLRELSRYSLPKARAARWRGKK